MSLLYAWATPEYMLWRMTIGQLVMWHNAGIEIKYPSPEEDKEKRSLRNMSADDRREAIRAAREAMKTEKKEAAEAKREEQNETGKEKYREIYGDI